MPSWSAVPGPAAAGPLARRQPGRQCRGPCGGDPLRPDRHPGRPVPGAPGPRRHSGPTPPEAAPGEAALIARLSPDPHAARHWATLAEDLTARARRGKAVNLDPAALLMDMLFRIDETAGALAKRQPARQT
jgi:hypothetical protein